MKNKDEINLYVTMVNLIILMNCLWTHKPVQVNNSVCARLSSVQRISHFVVGACGLLHEQGSEQRFGKMQSHVQ